MNSNTNIVCFCTEIERFYYSPVMILDYNLHKGDYQNLYLFLGISDNDGGFAPTIDAVKDVYKNIIIMKKINLYDIGVVAERIDWKENSFYDIYESNKNISARDDNGKLLKKFYVRNKSDQIFKCLWNNINSSNTFNITSIENNEYYYSIHHNGGTIGVGEYVTIQKVDPEEYNGTYLVMNSGVGVANVAYGSSGSHIITTDKEYVANGTIKIADLSKEEPVFDLGTFDEERIVRTSDGYVWKYIYTIDRAAKLKFFNDEWMPVPVNPDYPNPLLSPYGFGSIDTINIINGGSGYENGQGTVTVNIEGDGIGAEAQSFVSNNTITQISVVNHGKNYTYANITLQPINGQGANAEIQYTISPIGGHGFNFIRDLFSRNVMVVGSFIETENGKVPSDLTFNQIGLLYNPYTLQNNDDHSSDSLISRIITLNLAPSLEPGNYFIPGEYVNQKDLEGNLLYRGKAVSLDNANNILRVINKEGTISEGLEMRGEISLANRIIASNTESINSQTIYTPYSGNIFYLQNIDTVERNNKGIELVSIMLNYTQ